MPDPSTSFSQRRFLAAATGLLLCLTLRAAAASDIGGYGSLFLGMPSAQALQVLQGREFLVPCRSKEPVRTQCLSYIKPGSSFTTRVFVVFRNEKVRRIRVVALVDEMEVAEELCRDYFQILSKRLRDSFGQPEVSNQPVGAEGWSSFSLWEHKGRHVRLNSSWSKESQRCKNNFMEFVDTPPAEPYPDAHPPPKCGIEFEAEAWKVRTEQIETEMKARDAKYLEALKKKLRELEALGLLSEEIFEAYRDATLDVATDTSLADRKRLLGEISAVIEASEAPSPNACLRLGQLHSTAASTLERNEGGWQFFIDTVDKKIREVSY